MSPRMLEVSKDTSVKMTIGTLVGFVVAGLGCVAAGQKYKETIIDEVRTRAKVNDAKNVTQDAEIARNAQRLEFVAETVTEIKADVREIKSILLNRK